MFDRYTEQSRRVIFFARYEAGRMAAHTIEPEHLLLGIFKELPQTIEQFSTRPELLSEIPRRIESASEAAKGRSEISTSVDIPVSEDLRAALIGATEEADRMRSRAVLPEHLLLGLLGLKRSAIAAMLDQCGLDVDLVRQRIALEQTPVRGPILAPSLEPVVTRLSAIVEQASIRFPQFDEQRAATPVKAGGWSPKEILGHLIDSASNNHQRFVRAMLQPELIWPNYEQQRWVAVQGYEAADWTMLLRFWTAYNDHLISLLKRIPEEKTRVMCRIGDGDPLTLGQLAASYVDHVRIHVQQILGDGGGGLVA